MRLTLLLTTFLACNTTIYSMQHISDDMLIYSIVPRLDRPAKKALKSINTTYYKKILTQDELNKKYMAAYARKNIKAITLYKKMGGMSYYEEVSQAFYKNNDPLAKWLINTYRISVYSALQDSISDQDTVICQLLLDIYKPSTVDNKLYSCQTQAISLHNQNLIKIFTKYYNENDTGLCESYQKNW